MKVVKVLVCENPLLIDVSTAVVHYPGTGHTSLMTGGVPFDLCRGGEGGHGASRGDGVEEAMKRVEREDSWRPGISIFPVHPSRLCT